ncbi:MAG: hypothetical protein ACJA0K_001699 [Maricaulis maris]|jgi:hypothetical protein
MLGCCDLNQEFGIQRNGGVKNLETAERLLRSAFRENGGAKMISEKELWLLYSVASKSNMIVDGLEVYKIEGELQVPCTHLTVMATEIHDTFASIAWGEKIESMKTVILDIINQTRKDGGSYLYTAWVSKFSDWI